MTNMLEAAKAAKIEISQLSTQQKNAALFAMADALLAQKDAIIQKQDEQIANLIKSNEETVKSNKTNIISLKLQNEKYQEIIDKFTKTN